MKNVNIANKTNKLKNSNEVKINPSKLIKPTQIIPTLPEEIENLKSIYYQLEFLNYKLINTFSNQKNLAESIFYEKIDEIIKLRELNFNLLSQINGMKNISKIEEYLGTVYPKIHSIESKIANVLENIDDFKLNINYGLDRLYLEDNIVCDENTLIKNIDSTTNTLSEVIIANQEKFKEIETLKENYLEFLALIEEENSKKEKLKDLLKTKKVEVIADSIQKLIERLAQENKFLEENLFK